MQAVDAHALCFMTTKCIDAVANKLPLHPHAFVPKYQYIIIQCIVSYAVQFYFSKEIFG